MLRQNPEVIVLLDLKKPTNTRKQILKFITVKMSQFLSQWRSPKDEPISKPQLLYTFSVQLSITCYVN